MSFSSAWRSALFAFAVAVALSSSSATAIADLPPAVMQAVRDGRHEQAIAAIDQVLARIDVEQNRWQYGFANHAVHDVLVGKDHAYFATQARRDQQADGRPKPYLKFDPIDFRREGYSDYLVITCVDLATGNAKWSAAVMPNSRLAIDPRDDTLWSWREHATKQIIRFNPAAGQRTVVGELPAQKGSTSGNYDALIDGFTTIWALPNRNVRDQERVSYDLATKQVKENLPAPATVSPNGLRATRREHAMNRSTVSVAPLLGKPIWSLKVEATATNAATWFGDDVLILSGGQRTYGSLYRVNGETGEVRWQTRLPYPPYNVETTQLAGNFYPNADFPSAGRIDDQRLWCALNNQQILTIDAQSGAILASYSFPDNLLAPPTVRGKSVVLAGASGIRSVPLSDFLGTPDLVRAKLQMQRARSLTALKQYKEAVDAVARLVQLHGDVPQAWSTAADTMEAAGATVGPVAARLRAAAGGDQRAAGVLRDRFGLLHVINTEAIISPLIPVGPFIYVAEGRVAVLQIDTFTGEVADRTRGPEQATGAVGLSRDGAMMMGHWQNNSLVELRRFVPPPNLPEDDIAYGPNDPVGMPRDWYTINGYTGPSMRINGMWYRTVGQGKTRISDGTKLEEIQSSFPEITTWRLARVADGYLGHGTGGVYHLDERMVPVKRIYNPGLEKVNKTLNTAYQVAGDGKTVAVVAGQYSDCKFQIWTADFTRMIRQTQIRPGSDLLERRGRLIRLGEGYLACAGELVWLPDDPAKPEWRFDRAPGERPHWHSFDVEQVSFGPPRIAESGRIFIPGARSDIFVFDIARITETAR